MLQVCFGGWGVFCFLFFSWKRGWGWLGLTPVYSDACSTPTSANRTPAASGGADGQGPANGLHGSAPTSPMVPRSPRSPRPTNGAASGGGPLKFTVVVPPGEKLGLTLGGLVEGGVLVEEVKPGMQAEKHDVPSGKLLVMVNGVDIARLSKEDCIKKINKSVKAGSIVLEFKNPSTAWVPATRRPPIITPKPMNSAKLPPPKPPPPSKPATLGRKKPPPLAFASVKLALPQDDLHLSAHLPLSPPSPTPRPRPSLIPAAFGGAAAATAAANLGEPVRPPSKRMSAPSVAVSSFVPMAGAPPAKRSSLATVTPPGPQVVTSLFAGHIPGGAVAVPSPRSNSSPAGSSSAGAASVKPAVSPIPARRSSSVAALASAFGASVTPAAQPEVKRRGIRPAVASSGAVVGGRKPPAAAGVGQPQGRRPTPSSGARLPEAPKHSPASWSLRPAVGSITGPVFGSIPTKQIKEGQDPDKKKFNKYFDILPNPATIVELTSTAGMPRLQFDPGAFPYINANYIPGFDGKRTYIASQGPKEVGIPQFWRMIWQEGVKAVVMLTRFEERGKVKCSPYWGPTPGDRKSYAGFTVTTLKKTRSLYNYTVTELAVTADGESRNVRHYWFDAWPDLGVPPGDADDLLRLNEDVIGFRGDETYPLVVHCAAGIGRTGVFIGLDIAINSLHCTGDFALVPTIKMMRNNRGCMVQTAEQAGYLLALIDKYRSDCVSGEAKPRPVISRGVAVGDSGSSRGGGARRVPVGRRASAELTAARNGDRPPKPESDVTRSRVASAGRRGPPGMGGDDIAEPRSRNTSTSSAGRRGPPGMDEACTGDGLNPRPRVASGDGRRGPPGMGDGGRVAVPPSRGGSIERLSVFLTDGAPARAPPLAKVDYVAVADEEDGTSEVRGTRSILPRFSLLAQKNNHHRQLPLPDNITTPLPIHTRACSLTLSLSLTLSRAPRPSLFAIPPRRVPLLPRIIYFNFFMGT